jgi:purine-binding chemotaxis protein CheW
MNPVAIATPSQDSIHPELAVSSRWVSFELAGQKYAIAILKVFEVLSDADIEPVPCAPQSVLGVINLRGSIVTVIDLSVWLGLEKAAVSNCIIVLSHEGQAIGIRVDRILEVLDIAQNSINPVPTGTASNTASTVLGYVKRNDDLLTLLEFVALPDSTETSLAA